MAELIVTRFDERPAVLGRRRVHAEPGYAFALTRRALAVPEIEWRRAVPGVRLSLHAPGRPASWLWLGLGESALALGRALTLRAAVFDGGRYPARLVFDLED